MGNTPSLKGGREDALEGVFGDGRENAVCRSSARRRTDSGIVPRVWDLPQDRLQDRRSDQECGMQGLTDRSRRPYRYANQLPFQVENYILNVKREHASWGARKIRERLTRRFAGIPLPAKSTIHAVLDRHGLVARRGRTRRRAQGTPLSLGHRPNELWCTDYKGDFLLGNHHYCYPLTVTDHASRLLLACEALSSTKETYAFTVFERLFQ